MTYHAVTVTLENIGGIVVVKDKYNSTTQGVTFNATIAGKRQYAVVMRGNPRLDNGMVVTAVLRDPENWQTLAGWLNHATGEICGVDSPGQRGAICAFTILFGIVFLLRALRPDTSTAFMVVLISVMVGGNAWSMLALRKSLIVYRLLKPWMLR
ncbi:MULTISPECIES: hypothetical protein [Paraburkholderia]|uniref:Putative transmembrane protein n=1 Tax=Paraburkholderia dioscoreae TaxID=2604047 RepID=A0A5Q4YSK6_9BURK|nr:MULTISPECIES: hypothetical protein [Paraburkholderia]MDR8397475.1 hypothetical protein [Paraburkholderia sp. USG1]VVD27123.1 putative transmembrane protein [Paraburkholderia dioscoreae]